MFDQPFPENTDFVSPLTAKGKKASRAAFSVSINVTKTLLETASSWNLKKHVSEGLYPEMAPKVPSGLPLELLSG